MPERLAHAPHPFLHPDHRFECVEAAIGDSAIALRSFTASTGIVAACGGSALGATCHVYVDDNGSVGWLRSER